jgi:hypothetical protein
MSSKNAKKLDINSPNRDVSSMNRSREDSLAHSVGTTVIKGGHDRLWTYADFPGASRQALAAALSRLVKAGALIRVHRGVFYRPKSTVFGSSIPAPEALADAILRARGETPMPIGTSAFNALGITTQVSGAVSRASRRRGAPKELGGVRLYTTARPVDKQVGIRPEERAALEALRKITRVPDVTPRDVIMRIRMLLRSEVLDFGRLAGFARAEPPRVRALLGALGDEMRNEEPSTPMPVDAIKELRSGLNPLTSFKMRGAREALPQTADAWRIK